MLLVDESLEFVARDEAYPSGTIGDGRFAEYGKRLHLLGIDRCIKRRDPKVILFVYASAGLAGAGWAKGIAYSRDVLPASEVPLDQRSVRQGQTAYRPLGLPHWYLFFAR